MVVGANCSALCLWNETSSRGCRRMNASGSRRISRIRITHSRGRTSTHVPCDAYSKSPRCSLRRKTAWMVEPPVLARCRKSPAEQLRSGNGSGSPGRQSGGVVGSAATGGGGGGDDEDADESEDEDVATDGGETGGGGDGGPLQTSTSWP